MMRLGLSALAVPRAPLRVVAAVGVGLVSAGLTASCGSSPHAAPPRSAPPHPAQASGRDLHATTTKPGQAQPGPAACSASQLVLGKAKRSHGFGTLGTSSYYVLQAFRNVGRSCVLELPSAIGVSRAAGPFTPVAVTTSRTGTHAATSYTIPSGQSRVLALAAWWHVPGPKPPSGAPGAPGASASRCKAPITRVTRTRIPLPSGSLHIDLGTALPSVCPSPASMSLTVKA